MKKKAAIITWCDNNGPTNYGQILQCYAIQRVCESLGLEVFIIQYRRKGDRDFLRGSFRTDALNQIYELLFKLFVIEKRFDLRIYRFRKFIRENIKLSCPCYSKTDIDKLVEKASFLICGSDQIWNPIWFDPVFLLDFGHERHKRIAYAPSGIAVENEEFSAIYKQMGALIGHMDSVSMREAQGIRIMRKYTDQKMEAVLDPTLLLDTGAWNFVSAKCLFHEPYIFCYTMGGMRSHMPMLRQIMKRHHASRIIYLPSNVVEDQPHFAVPYKKAGPAEFISLIRYAKAVATDSFHGTALSIKYNKQFYLLNRVQQDCYLWANSSRIDHILDKLHIGQRLVNNRKDVMNISDIDYSEINRYADAAIKESINFLKDALL